MSVRQSCQCLIDWRFSRIFLVLNAQLVLLSGSQRAPSRYEANRLNT